MEGFNGVSVEQINACEKKISALLAEGRRKPLELARLYVEVGKGYYGLEKFKTAAQNYESAIELFQEAYGEDTNKAELADCYECAGLAYFYTRERVKALSRLGTALKIREKIHENDAMHPSIADAKLHMGLVWLDAGFHMGALGALDPALDIYLRVYGEDAAHPRIAEAYNYKGLVTTWIEDPRGAFEHYKKSLEIWQRCENNAQTYLGMALCYGNIGVNYFFIGDTCETPEKKEESYKKSIKYYEKSLEIKKQVYGDDENHHFVAMNYSNIGSSYIRLGDYEKATEMYKKCLKINKAIYTDQPDHPAIVRCYEMLAYICEETDDWRGVAHYRQMIRKLKGE